MFSLFLLFYFKHVRNSSATENENRKTFHTLLLVLKSFPWEERKERICLGASQSSRSRETRYETKSVYLCVLESENCTSWFLNNVPSWLCFVISLRTKDLAWIALSTYHLGLFLYGRSRSASKFRKVYKMGGNGATAQQLFLQLRLWNLWPRRSSFESE